MSTAAEQPCPFCGEMIKAHAVKCRFCGEFLDEEAAPPQPKKGLAAKDKAWLVPVGRSIWSLLAGYFGIFALIPFAIVVWGFAEVSDVKTDTKATLFYVCAGLNLVLGMLALLLGIVAVITLVNSQKSGMVRGVFAIIAGLVGGVGYILLIHFYWIPTYVRLAPAMPNIPVKKAPAL